MGAAFGGGFGVLNAGAIGLTEWDAAIGAPARVRTPPGHTPASALEGAAVAFGQGVIAYNFLKVVGAPDELAWAGAGAAFFNGGAAGVRGIYNWTSPTGWLAAGFDSTFGLVGTTLGTIVNLGNMAGGATYSAEASYRQNRTVFTDGARLKGDHAFTLGGNVISNMNPTSTALMNHHETLHLWQSRLFGPVWHATYAAWGIGGAVGGGAVGLFSGNAMSGAEAGGYTSNPFEYLAYTNQGVWTLYASGRYPSGAGVVWPQ
jgi:hypothetical protein